MKESVSYTYLLNIIIIFILVAFMVLMATLSYTKAFRVNSKIANAVEICEGYNSCSEPEVNRIINNYGYQNRVSSCPKKNGVQGTKKNGFCLYEYNPDGDSKHYSYGILTFMYIDIPVIGDLVKIPVYSKTDRIYYFS